MNPKYTNQLSRIVINGYKSIKDCDIELKKINVFIGSNGAGKSNFISVFELLQNISTQNLSRYVAKKGVNSLFYKGAKTTDTISLELYFNNTDEPKPLPYTIELEISDNNNIVLHENPVVFGGSVEIPPDTLAVSSAVRPYIKHEWRVHHFHDTGWNSRIKAEHNVSNNKTLMFDASNLAAYLYRLRTHHQASYMSIVRTIQLVAPYFNDFELEPNEENRELIVLRWRQKGCEDIFNASQLSDGTLRFICLATLFLQPEQLQPAIIIVDEPELGLHPFAITIFSELVQKAAISKQIILSTQSTELLDQFDAEDVVVVDHNGEGTKFKRLNTDELTYWLNNDYSLSELWNKNILGGRLSK